MSRLGFDNLDSATTHASEWFILAIFHPELNKITIHSVWVNPSCCY
jgi:hypothetical protein